MTAHHRRDAQAKAVANTVPTFGRCIPLRILAIPNMRRDSRPPPLPDHLRGDRTPMCESELDGQSHRPKAGTKGLGELAVSIRSVPCFAEDPSRTQKPRTPCILPHTPIPEVLFEVADFLCFTI